MLKVRVSRCRSRLFVLPQNWHLEPNIVTKESVSTSCHQSLRPVISLRTYYKAAKQTCSLPPLKPLPPFSPPSFITNRGKQSPGESVEEEVTEALVQKLFLHALSQHLPALKAREMECQGDRSLGETGACRKGTCRFPA